MKRNFLTSIFFILAILQSISGQLSIEPYERHFLSSLFESSSKKKWARISEEYDDLKPSRVWIFDEKGRLYSEVDYRESGFDSSINGESFGSILSNFKEYTFSYDSGDEISEVLETFVLNGDTLKMSTEYNRSGATVIKETFTVVPGGIMEKEFIETTYLSNGSTDSVLSVLVTRGSGLEYQSKNKTVLLYEDQDKLKQELHYFFNSDSHEEEKNGKEAYRMVAITNHGYDEVGRLNEIEYLEINEEGEQVLNYKASYTYLRDSEKIDHVKFHYGKAWDVESVDFLLDYDAEGNLFRVRSDFGVIHYKYEKRS